MDNITVVFTKQEAIAVKFALGGARHTIHSEPHFVAPLGEAIVKLDAALAPPAPAPEPEEKPAA
jgi:hypothetical protein